jgi:cytochrome c peroxidase
VASEFHRQAGNVLSKLNKLAIRAFFIFSLGVLGACSNPSDPPQQRLAEADAEAEFEAGAEYASGETDVVSIEPVAPMVLPERDPRLTMFAPLPPLMDSASNPITLAKVNLGRKLYYDPRLSKNQDVSCNTCHMLDKYGVDGLPTSVGHLQQVGARNAPTVYNAAGHIAQFWDGRSPDVEDQAKGPPLNPIEMAMADEAGIEAVLNSIPGYVSLFAAAFPDEENPVIFDNMAKAIGAFERGLVTPTGFDDYLAGDEAGLSQHEKEGLTAFLDAGCATCHSGPYIGGGMYQKIGLVQPWGNDTDQGRYDVTGEDADRQVFKVPSLRNIAETGPYFHDGSVKTLNEAVRLMAEHQLGIPVTNEQVIAIISFLNSLTGDIDPAYIAMPDLPESSPSTPAPDPT